LIESILFDLLKEKAYQIKNQEIRRGTTLIGPQKDELGIYINDFEAKENASQGQHKSLLIALKFAEFKYMSDILKETPVILFDDIFTELDFERSRKVISFINENKAQTFITITNTNRLKSFDKDNKHTYFYIDNGNVKLKDKL